MKEESKNSQVDIELETRIVALVLGEASDFERDQLDRLIAGNPELATLKARFEAVHGLMCDVGAGEPIPDGEAWELSAERRSTVLAAIAGEAHDVDAEEGAATTTVSLDPTTKSVRRKRSIVWSFASVATVFCVVGFFGLIVAAFQSISKSSLARSELSRESARRQLALATPSPSSGVANVPAVRYAESEGVMNGISRTDGELNGRASTRDVAGFKAEERNYWEDSKSSLSAIQDSLSTDATLPTPYYLKDDIQTFSGGNSEGKPTEHQLPLSSANDEYEMVAGLVKGWDQPAEPTAKPPVDSLAMRDLQTLGEKNILRSDGSNLYSDFQLSTPDLYALPAPEAAESSTSPATASIGLGFSVETADAGTRFSRGRLAEQEEAEGEVLRGSRLSDLEKSDISKLSVPEVEIPQVALGTQGGDLEKSRESLPTIRLQQADVSSTFGLRVEPSTTPADVKKFAGSAELDNGVMAGRGVGGGIAAEATDKANADKDGTGAFYYGDSPNEGLGTAGKLMEPAPANQSGATEWMASGLTSKSKTRSEDIPPQVAGVTPTTGTIATADTKMLGDVTDVDSNYKADNAKGFDEQSRLQWLSKELNGQSAELREEFRDNGAFQAGADVGRAEQAEEKTAQKGISNAGQVATNRRRFGNDLRFRKGKEIESLKFAELNKAAAPSGLNEISTDSQAFSTFSLHVSDVSFKLAQAALAQGKWPDPSRVRIEEFVNAFDYGDPLPSQNEKVACSVEQSIHPFLQQRNLMRVSMRTAAAGRSSETPLRLTFLLDNSGSMERLDRQETVRRAFALLAKQLTPADQVTLISFARQPRLLADKVGGAQSGQLVDLIDSLPSEGGTNIEAALQLAFEKAREQQVGNAQNRIVLLTDGAVNLGDANPESLSQLIVQMRDAGIAFDAAGISAEGLNDEVLEALTRQGDGRYYLLDSAESVDDGFAQQIAGALRPSAKNVKVQIEFNPKRVGQYKLLGFEKHLLNKEDFRNDQVDAAEMAAEEAGVAVYQFEVKADGEGDVGSVSVRFRDLSTGQMVENRWPIPYASNPPRPDQAAPSLRIATAAALLAAKLRGEALGESVDLKVLSDLLAELPGRDRSARRVQQLQMMIAQARQIIGN